MHDLDRSLDVFETDSDQEWFLEDEWNSDSRDEFDFAQEFEVPAGGDRAFTTDEELELAAELLTVSDEEELEQFLGKLVKKAWKGAKRFAKSSAGKALGGLLKSAARKVLPLLGRAAGTYFGGPAGGAIGGRLASAAGKAFGLELEGMAPEEQELEVARRFVRFAGAAARRASRAPVAGPPLRVARRAYHFAARRHAPGLVGVRTWHSGSAPSSGRWFRQGPRIVLLLD